MTKRRDVVVMWAIALAIGCGAHHEETVASDPVPREDPPVAADPAPAPAPVAVAVAPTLPSLPFTLTAGSPRPPSGSSEEAVVARWAHILGIDYARDDYDLQVARTDLAWLGPDAILSFQGRDPNEPPEHAVMGVMPQHVEYLLVEDDRAGRRIVVRFEASAALPPASSELRPWLTAVLACDDATLVGAPDVEALTAACTDLRPRVGATLRARLADAATRRDETLRFFTELAGFGAPLVDIDDGPLRGERMRGARFVPFGATSDATSTTVTGTVRLSLSCYPVVEHARFVLHVTDQTVTLERAPLSREVLQTRCQ